MTATPPPDSSPAPASSPLPQPHRRWRGWLAGVLVLLLPLLLLASLFSAPGLRAGLALAERLSGGALQVAAVTGSLGSGRVQLRGLALRTASTDYQLDVLDLHWQPAQLWQGEVRITTLALGVLRLTARAPDPTPPSLPEQLTLPLALTLEHARLARLELGQLAMGPFALSAHSDGRQHHLQLSEAITPWGSSTAALQLDGVRPFALAGVWRHGGQLAQAPINGEVHLAGTLGAVKISLAVGYQHSALGAHATLAPFAALPFARLRQAEVTLAQFNPAQWLPGAPAAEISLSASSTPVSGQRQRIQLRARNALAGPWPARRLPWQGAQAELDVDDNTLTVRQLSVQALDGELDGSGSWQGQTLNFTSRLRGLRLRTLASALPDWPADGQLAVRGQMSAPQLSLSLNDRQQRELHAELTLTGPAQARLVRLSQLQLRDGAARLEGSGDLALAGNRRFSLTATLRQLNPARWSTALADGTLNAQVTVSGNAQPLSAQIELNVDPSSHYRGLPVSAQLRGQWAGQRAQGLRLAASLGHNRLAADGALGGPQDVLNFTLAAPQLSQLGGEFAGSAQGQGKLSGKGWQLRLAGLLDIRQLRAPGGVSVEQLLLDARLPDNLDQAGQLSLTLRQLRAGGWQLAQADARYQGSRPRHSLSMQARGRGPLGDFDARLAAEGGWQSGRGWQGQLTQLSNQGRLALNLDAPLALSVVDARHWQLTGLRGRLLGARLNAPRLAQDGHTLSGQGQLSGMVLTSWLKLLDSPPPLDGSLVLAVDWNLSGNGQGQLNLRRESGDVWLSQHAARPLGLEHAQLQLNRRDTLWKGQATLRSQTLGSLTAQGQLSSAAGQLLPGPASTMQLSANAELPNLAAWATWLPPGIRLSGRASASLSADGALNAPRWRGSLKADALGVQRPSDGIAFRDGQLRASLQDDMLKLDSLTLRDPQGGHLTLRGSANWRQPDSTQLTLTLHQLAVLSHPNRSLSVSGQAQLRQSGSGLLLSGGLTVDKGRIVLPENDTPTLSSDVVIVGQPAREPDAPLAVPVAVALDLDLGEQFHLIGKGLNTRLAGQLRLSAAAGQSPSATGSVRVVSGYYAAYGQRLDISRGVLTFVHRLDNPGLDVLAVRRGLSVEPGVEISGSAQAPRVQLVSTPELPDSEKLSWLVLGRSATSLRGGETELLFSAASTLLGSGNAMGIQQQLASRLGLDELNVGAASTRPSVRSTQTSSTSHPLDNQVLTLGKRLSSGLYLGYEQSLTGVGAAVKLTWEWSKNWSVVLRAGEQSALDAVYGRGFD